MGKVLRWMRKSNLSEVPRRLVTGIYRDMANRIWRRNQRLGQLLVMRVFALKPRKAERDALHGGLSIGMVSPGNVEVVVISNRPIMAKRAIEQVKDFPVRILDGTGFESFSHLVNSAIESSGALYVVVVGDKCYPSDLDVKAGVLLLSQGYGLVGLFRFGCFAVRRDVFEFLGGFDEGFIGGQFEDNDFLLRLWEANIGCFETEGIHYFPLDSSWNSVLSKEYFHQKWDLAGPPARRLPRRSLELASKRPPGLFTWQESRLMARSLRLGVPPPF